MADLSTFITAHPLVTFGVFLVLWQIASSIGGRCRYKCNEKEDE